MKTTLFQGLISGIIYMIVIVIIYSCTTESPPSGETSEKPRVIVTTDGETDDKASFVRFLLYTTDFDIEALIYTNSMWHLEGNGTEWMHEFIDAYAGVYDNLIVHHPDYPTPAFLKSKIYVGQMEQVGRAAVGEGWDTPGSDKIVEVLLDEDPRPVWLQAWGGLNNIAQALYRIRESYPDQLERATEKAWIYAIAEQDDLKEWMHEAFPEINYILNMDQFWRVMAYSWDRLNPYDNHEVYTVEWTTENVKNVRPLGAIYDRDELEEGDTPAFLHVVNTGLRSHKKPSWGGWGGRFQKTGPGNLWTIAEDNGDNTKPLWRFIVTIQEDFAARMQWSATSKYEEANHEPVVRLNHDENMKVKAGEEITLDASPSYDPDGDSLTFLWWVYAEAGTYDESVEIQKYENPVARMTVPENATGKSIHIICEVKDDAYFPMTRYKRVILNVD